MLLRRINSRRATIGLALALFGSSASVGWLAGLRDASETASDGLSPSMVAVGVLVALCSGGLIYAATGFAFVVQPGERAVRVFSLDTGWTVFDTEHIRRVTSIRVRSTLRIMIDDGVRRVSFSARVHQIPAVVRTAVASGDAAVSAKALRVLGVAGRGDTVRNPLWLLPAGLGMVVLLVGGLLAGYAIGNPPY